MAVLTALLALSELAKINATLFPSALYPKAWVQFLEGKATACALGPIRPDSSCHSYLTEIPGSDGHSRTARDRIDPSNPSKKHVPLCPEKTKGRSGSNTDIQTILTAHIAVLLQYATFHRQACEFLTPHSTNVHLDQLGSLKRNSVRRR